MMVMPSSKKMKNLINQLSSGIISAQKIFVGNISRSTLNKFIESGELLKCGRGLYIINSFRSRKCYFCQTQYDTMEELADSFEELLSSALLDSGIITYVLLKRNLKSYYLCKEC